MSLVTERLSAQHLWYLKALNDLVYKALVPMSRGSRFTCSVCSTSLRWFFPYAGGSFRRNAVCPNCQSLERHRLIWKYVEKETNLLRSKRRMLHIAPEHCLMKQLEKLPQLEYVTADLESPLAAIHLNIHDTPFRDGYFDVIFCNHVLEHVENDAQVMGELLRILHPDGFALLQVPINQSLDKTFEDASIVSPREREKAFGQRDHVRQYGRDYGERLLKAGFKVEKRHIAKEIGENEALRFGLDLREHLHVCRK